MVAHPPSARLAAVADDRFERLANLVTYLLDAGERGRNGTTFAEIVAAIPGYPEGDDARRRAFERDKKLLRDEIDRYPDDVDNNGSPLDMSDGRLISFLQSGDWRKIDVSTPTLKGASKIEERYLAGDQRRWHVRCPVCGDGDGQPGQRHHGGAHVDVAAPTLGHPFHQHLGGVEQLGECGVGLPHRHSGEVHEPARGLQSFGQAAGAGGHGLDHVDPRG